MIRAELTPVVLNWWRLRTNTLTCSSQELTRASSSRGLGEEEEEKLEEEDSRGGRGKGAGG